MKVITKYLAIAAISMSISISANNLWIQNNSSKPWNIEIQYKKSNKMFNNTISAGSNLNLGGIENVSELKYKGYGEKLGEKEFKSLEQELKQLKIDTRETAKDGLIIIQHGYTYGWYDPITKIINPAQYFEIAKTTNPWEVRMLQKAQQAKDSGQTSFTIARYIFNLPKDKPLTKKIVIDRYRNLSRTWHPDKVEPSMKSIAGKVMQIINKAKADLLKGTTVTGRIELVRKDLESALNELSRNPNYIQDKALFGIMDRTHQNTLLKAQQNDNRRNLLQLAESNLRKYKQLFTWSALTSPIGRTLQNKFSYIHQEIQDILKQHQLEEEWEKVQK